MKIEKLLGETKVVEITTRQQEEQQKKIKEWLKYVLGSIQQFE